MNEIIGYSIALFAIVLTAGCIVNLLKQHFIFQIIGIAFFFTYSIINCFILLEDKPAATIGDLYFVVLPQMTGISACLISMVIGFWIFPLIRRKIKL